MSDAETAVLKHVQIEGGKSRAVLLRNNRGVFYTMDGVKSVISAIMTGNLKAAKEAARRLRVVSAGLEAPGSSDLAGVIPVVITQEMVGMTLGWAIFAEVKRRDWQRPTGKTEEQQENFINQMLKIGACAFFINDQAQFAKKVADCLKNMIDKHLKGV